MKGPVRKKAPETGIFEISIHFVIETYGLHVLLAQIEPYSVVQLNAKNWIHDDERNYAGNIEILNRDKIRIFLLQTLLFSIPWVVGLNRRNI